MAGVRGRSRSSDYAHAQEVDSRTARRHLNHFEEMGLVRKSGPGAMLDIQ